MKLPEFAVKRPVTVTMLALALILFGIISLSHLGLDFLPEIEFPITAIVVPYPGADPFTVEEQITKVLEPSLKTVSGINNIIASSGENLAVFVLEFKWGTDLKEVAYEVRSLLDIVSASLPKEASKPIIYRINPNQIPLSAVSVAAEDTRTASLFVEDVLKPSLESIEEVGKVDVSGQDTHEIVIEYDLDKMKQFNISPVSLSQIIGYQNLKIPAGQIVDEDKLYNVKAGHLFTSLDDLKEIVVGQVSNSTQEKPGASFFGFNIPRLIKLQDIANVEEVFRHTGQITTINGSPAVVATIFKAADANSVRASREVSKKLKEIQTDGVTISTLFDQSDLINESLNSLALNGLFGGILAILVLILFLRDWRSTLVTALAIPFSVIVTFSIMYAFKLDINLISLGGLALGLGMLVDNAIVVIENIYRKLEEGMEPAPAAIEGTTEVGMAITASTLTTLVVFLPVVFMSSLAGNLFRELALTVTFSLVSSLFVALTIVPLLASKIVRVNSSTQESNNTVSGFKRFEKTYREYLSRALQAPRKWLIGTGILVALSLLLIPFMHFEMLPEESSNQISVSLNLPSGTTKDKTHGLIKEIEPDIKDLPFVDKVYTVAGSSNELGFGGFSSNLSDSKAIMTVILEDNSAKGLFRKKPDAFKVADMIRDILNKAQVRYPTLETKVSVDSLFSQSGLQSGLSVKVKGKNDKDVEEAALLVLEELKTWTEFASVNWSYGDKEPLMDITLDPTRVLMGGQVTAQVALGVRQAVVGEKVGELAIENTGKKIPIFIKAKEESVKTLTDLENLYFSGTMSSTSQGPLMGLRLGNVIEIEKTDAPLSLQREGGERVIEISTISKTAMNNKASKRLRAYIDELKLEPGITVELGGMEKLRKNALRDLLYALILALILVYMVMASQFEALLAPFIIMITMPLALIGSLVLLFFYSRTLSITAILGMIILAGIVVNNGIVLVDYINQLRKKGLSLKDAVIQGASDRLRAILMTALTTILGLLPQALSIGSSTNMQVPMAISVMGGLITSTFLTLIIIPIIYWLFYRKTEKELR